MKGLAAGWNRSGVKRTSPVSQSNDEPKGDAGIAELRSLLALFAGPALFDHLASAADCQSIGGNIVSDT